MDAPRPIRWESLTKKDFDAVDRSRAVVLVTCSPMEVHGPHLPLGADALEGQGLTDRALRFVPERHRDRTFLSLPFIYAATDTVPSPARSTSSRLPLSPSSPISGARSRPRASAT